MAKKPTKAETETKAETVTEVATTRFRAHFRLSSDNDKHKMDVDAVDIGDVHKQVRDKHQTDEVMVFIDKVKVLLE